MAAKFLLLFLSLVISSEGEDYYWRHFNGTIPDDALIGAKNFGYNQYIGRGPTYGLWIGPIIPGSNIITVANPNGMYKIQKHLEILCSDKQTNFTWISTNSSSIESLSGLVKGGFYFDDLTNFYVGRIALSSQEYAIGHINQYHDYTFYYGDHSNETISFTSKTYEVLTNSP